ncbi:flagellar assembly protein FliW [Oceanirhabdus seepicola]|uniref:Flagellar assembly factor FliW n=1 Tax=Oceanirhabdus seepicola TaxID=2828781 RepID=A0A9J6NY97_9CLOT|nr:flagellar assembly protein FliW [Oceanirhabdus seepicola]MCM1988112.1 flagellar assembly protein FliW [Oceanirhabdus seepicola]
MELISKVHGKIEYTENEVIRFGKGLLGFEGLNNFIIKEIEGNPIFKLMHSLDNMDVAFVIISTFECEKHYEIKLNEDTLSGLQIYEPSDVVLYSIVTLHSEMKNITANLRAPLAVNIKKNLGEQIIINKEEYLVKHPIFKGVTECL